jgi:hypothetical protein
VPPALARVVGAALIEAMGLAPVSEAKEEVHAPRYASCV